MAKTTNYGEKMLKLEIAAVEWSRLNIQAEEAKKIMESAKNDLREYIDRLLGRLNDDYRKNLPSDST